MSKLNKTGTIIFITFITYSIVTIFSVVKDDMYSKKDYLYDSIIKICDIISIITILYLYLNIKAYRGLAIRQISVSESRSKSGVATKRSRRESVNTGIATKGDFKINRVVVSQNDDEELVQRSRRSSQASLLVPKLGDKKFGYPQIVASDDPSEEKRDDNDMSIDEDEEGVITPRRDNNYQYTHI